MTVTSNSLLSPFNFVGRNIHSADWLKSNRQLLRFGKTGRTRGHVFIPSSLPPLIFRMLSSFFFSHVRARACTGDECPAREHVQGQGRYSLQGPRGTDRAGVGVRGEDVHGDRSRVRWMYKKIREGRCVTQPNRHPPMKFTAPSYATALCFSLSLLPSSVCMVYDLICSIRRSMEQMQCTGLQCRVYTV